MVRYIDARKDAIRGVLDLMRVTGKSLDAVIAEVRVDVIEMLQECRDIMEKEKKNDQA